MTSKRIIRIMLLIGAILVLTYSIVQLTHGIPAVTDWSVLLATTSVRAAAVFFFVFLSVVMLRAIRFATLVSWHSLKLFGPALRIFPTLFFLAAITPLRLGEMARIEWMRRHANLPLLGASSLICERLMDMTVLLLLLALGLHGARDSTHELVETTVSVVIAIAVGSGYLSAIILGFVGPRKLNGAFARFADGFKPLTDFRRHGMLLLFTVAAWLPLIPAYLWVIQAFAPSATATAAALVLASVNLSYLISPIPANIGTFQAVAMGSLMLFGVDPAAALLAAIAIQGANLAATIVIGGIGLLSIRTLQPLAAHITSD